MEIGTTKLNSENHAAIANFMVRTRFVPTHNKPSGLLVTRDLIPSFHVEMIS